MSGVLSGCRAAPAQIMRVRDEGRVLILGMTSQGEVLGYVATADDPVTAELNAHDWPMVGVFLELPLTLTHAEGPRAQLISELHRIWQLQWIASQKLAPDGTKAPYAARNGGGSHSKRNWASPPTAMPNPISWDGRSSSMACGILCRSGPNLRSR